MFKRFFERIEKKTEDQPKKPVSPDSFYTKRSIEWGPQGGRSLEAYEKQLQFDRNDLQHKNILDLGSGSEQKFAKELEESGIHAMVVSFSPDYSQKEIADAARDAYENSDMVAGVGQKLPFKDGSFDRVFGFHFFEHTSEDVFLKIIREVCRVVNREGYAKIGPVYDSSWNPWDSVMRNEDIKDLTEKYHLEISKEDIPEDILPKQRVKFPHNPQAFYVPTYTIVIRGKSEAT